MRHVGPLILALIACILAARSARALNDDLRVFVDENASRAELQIQIPPSVDPASVEVKLAGLEVTVVARDARTGEEVRSRTLRLQGPAVEEGALAEDEGEGWLAVKLRKKPLESRSD
jgi:hypothetical protein